VGGRNHRNNGIVRSSPEGSTTTTESTHHLYGVSHTSLDVRVLALDARFDQARMTKNKTRGSSHKPEESQERRGEPQERNADHEEPHVEGLLGDDMSSDVDRPLVIDESVDDSKPSKEEDDRNEEEGTCDNGIYRQSSNDESIIAREIPGVVSQS